MSQHSHHARSKNISCIFFSLINQHKVQINKSHEFCGNPFRVFSCFSVDKSITFAKCDQLGCIFICVRSRANRNQSHSYFFYQLFAFRLWFLYSCYLLQKYFVITYVIDLADYGVLTICLSLYKLVLCHQMEAVPIEIWLQFQRILIRLIEFISFQLICVRIENMWPCIESRCSGFP